MQTGEFERAALQLVNLACKSPAAIMCAEGDPMYCHRSLIADYLVSQGVKVLHILKETIKEHQLSPYARWESLQLVYDRHVTDELDLR